MIRPYIQGLSTYKSPNHTIVAKFKILEILMKVVWFGVFLLHVEIIQVLLLKITVTTLHVPITEFIL